jgi:hypothetical protein
MPGGQVLQVVAGWDALRLGRSEEVFFDRIRTFCHQGIGYIRYFKSQDLQVAK